MKFKLFITAVLVIVAFTGFQSVKVAEDPKVNWMTFEEAVEKSKTAKKKIFIDVYTDWCGWCKVMDKKTFSHEIVSTYLNENFYAVKLNAEQRENIIFRGKTYKFIPSGAKGYHELAASLLNGKLSYPSVVFLDEDFNMLQPLAGYQEPKFFDQVLKFIGEEHYKSTKWTDFQKSYVSPI
ncbi:MAG: DUF255 domain-containing protein [Cyclobacteriaceae bacterium]|nr:DUF255 domain-containing protein [Cyclobacteriaceae bacterium]